MPFSGLPFQRVSRKSAVGLHVADFGLDHRAPVADQNLGLVDVMAAIAPVDDNQFGRALGRDFYLLKLGAQRVTAVRIARRSAHADDKALIERRGDADLAAEFIAHQRLTFENATDLGRVQGIAGR